ncbi:sugar phosphate nucleotidyltransferase [Clostridium sp. 'White wine YQ']|uniref:sugar phosphate nucleotidyltransferase n=1 Tax=Clostridium sp. 'White wine YQ' TaxID=3027474 RepID=UPI0023668CF2|nr:sugar phosphate nucleotidyltransferase [Clostridium sp. 'White wine YQ']MDD7792777.1 sugar phosphate nucleotidyltransferase [Clostridium sp. 'White wine YQ']
MDDGSYYELELSYAVQASPNGLAETFIIDEELIENYKVAFVLGENFLYCYSFIERLKKAAERDKATIFDAM